MFIEDFKVCVYIHRSGINNLPFPSESLCNSEILLAKLERLVSDDEAEVKKRVKRLSQESRWRIRSITLETNTTQVVEVHDFPDASTAHDGNAVAVSLPKNGEKRDAVSQKS